MEKSGGGGGGGGHPCGRALHTIIVRYWENRCYYDRLHVKLYPFVLANIPIFNTHTHTLYKNFRSHCITSSNFVDKYVCITLK